MLNFPSSPALNDVYTSGGRTWKYNGVAWEPQAPDLYVPKSGGIMFGGLGFNPAVGASPTDFSKHISLYGTTYGISITGSRYNHVCDATASHRLMAGSTDCLAVSVAGTRVLKGVLGYGPGNGAAPVTQLTNKTTPVGLDKPSGKIITHAGLLGAGAAASFILYNNTIGADDGIHLSFVPSGSAFSSENYIVGGYTELGLAVITLINRSGAGLSNAVGIRFTVLGGASS